MTLISILQEYNRTDADNGPPQMAQPPQTPPRNIYNDSCSIYNVYVTVHAIFT
jgi:hypothetical protein